MSGRGNGVRMQDNTSAQHDAGESIRRRQQEFTVTFFDTLVALGGNPYRALKCIGEGRYGIVIKAQNEATGEKVAVKRMYSSVYGPAMTIRVLRELKLLRLLSAHENIIKVKDVLIPRDPEKIASVFVVFELMPATLRRVLRSSVEVTPAHKKYFMFQILRGVHFMHSAGISHMDLNPSDIMVNRQCKLRIIDMGSARARFSNESHFWSMNALTRWYRAPELIVKNIDVNCDNLKAIDMWSVGCIFAEIFERGHALFRGRNARTQYEVITDLLGTPTPELLAKWGGSDRWTMMCAGKSPRPLRDLLPGADPLAVSLIEQMLVFDPDQRINALEALYHPYFSEYLHLGLGAECDPLSSDEFHFEREIVAARNAGGTY